MQEEIKSFEKIPNKEATKSLLSDLEEIILLILSGKTNLYGLQISKAIETSSEGEIQVGFGSLYPALRRLETRNLVESHWGEDCPEERGGARRRYYNITPSGEESLERKKMIKAKIANYTIATA